MEQWSACNTRDLGNLFTEMEGVGEQIWGEQKTNEASHRGQKGLYSILVWFFCCLREGTGGLIQFGLPGFVLQGEDFFWGQRDKASDHLSRKACLQQELWQSDTSGHQRGELCLIMWLPLYEMCRGALGICENKIYQFGGWVPHTQGWIYLLTQRPNYCLMKQVACV